MNQFLEGFLQAAPEKLAAVRYQTEILRELLLAAGEEGEDLTAQTQTRQILRQIFQQTHTLKGSAAAFGIEAMSASAHETENLLDGLRRGEIVCDLVALDALCAGIENIETALAALQKKDVAAALPKDLLVKIRGLTRRKTNCGSNENQLPSEFSDKLNGREKEHLQQITAAGANPFVAAVEFPLAEFKTKIQNLRSALEQNGEIIALLPGSNNSSAIIALQIVFAVAADVTSNSLTTIETFGGQILFGKQNTTLIAETAATALFAGRRAAIELGKQIEFKVSGGQLKILTKQADALATGLLHLITNAVVHGIESSEERSVQQKQPHGTVRVIAEQKDGSIYVRVEDDGRGIDFEKLARMAEGKFGFKFDLETSDLTPVQNLIFAPGFSTAVIITQVAGRGIGLDAAKSAVESVGGTITVKSEVGTETTFEIVLPQT